MRLRVQLPIARQIPSHFSIVVASVLAGSAVFSIAILLQWLIYDDWLHANGPLRLVGSVLAFLLTSGFVCRWLESRRRQKIEMLRRLETIQWMNDRIRNCLQAIECVVYATNPHVTDPVRDAVDGIEDVLQEMLTQPPHSKSARQAASGVRTPLHD